MTHKLNINDIQPLLDRYMNGENTLEELQLLSDFFACADELPAELQPYQKMFEVLAAPPAVPSDKAIKRFVPPTADARRSLRLWPWIATACAACAIATVLLAPPKTDKLLTQQVERQITAQNTTLISPKKESSEPQPAPLSRETVSEKQRTQINREVPKSKEYSLPTEEEIETSEQVLGIPEPEANTLLATTDEEYQRQMDALRQEATRYVLEQEFKEYDRYLHTSSTVIEREKKDGNTLYIVYLEL